MKNNQIYIGFTNDLEVRMKQHNSGSVFTTKKYLPAALVYFEAYLSEKDAKQREKMLKRYGSTYVHLKHRIIHSISKSQGRG